MTSISECERKLTTKAVTIRYLEHILGANCYEITIPAGTLAEYIDSPGGGWAVASVDLLVQLTGNKHDPQYRYCWLPPEAFLP